MKLAGLLLLIAALSAGDAGPVRVDVVAVHAFSQQRGEKVYDKELNEFKDALADLDEYDTFHLLSLTTIECVPGEEAQYTINTRYKLCVKPLARAESGQVRLSLRVEMSPKGPDAKPVNAISTTLLISPEKRLKLRGLKLDRGELVLVLTLRNQPN